MLSLFQADFSVQTVWLRLHCVTGTKIRCITQIKGCWPEQELCTCMALLTTRDFTDVQIIKHNQSYIRNFVHIIFEFGTARVICCFSGHGSCTCTALASYL